MKCWHRASRAGAVVIVVLGTVGLSRDGTESASISTYTGITKPSQEVKMFFSGPGIVKEVAVKDGDPVQRGQLLIAQDDRIESKMLEIKWLEANSTLPVEFAKTDLESRKVLLARIQKSYDGGVATDTELQEAKVAVDLATIKVRLANQEAVQKKLEAEAQEIKVSMMSLKSPADGVIKKVEVDVGEVVDPNQPSCIIVTNDPLWVEVYIPADQAARLSIGQRLDISAEGKPKAVQAPIIYLDPVVDARSNMRLVRLEMPNSSGKETGLRVDVKLPGAEGTARANP